jgi:LEA14-like dessication related protein
LIQCTFFKALVGIQPRKPEVHLLKLQVKKVDLKSIELVAQLAIQNPNDFQLRFSDVNYQLSIHGKLVAEGVYTDEMVIRSSATTTLDVPIRLNTMEAVQTVFRFFQDRTALAKWTANANFISPLGKIAIHFSDEKELH